MNFQLIYGVILVFVTTSGGQMQNKCDLTAQPQCSADCSTILLCSAGMENPLGSVRCSLNTPFCEKGVCTEIPGSCSLRVDPSSFLCTSAGVFPDPSNCVRYHYCSDTGSTSVPHECPFGNIFNSKTKVCQRGVPRGSSRKICQKISCKESGYVAFTANPAFYALCSSTIGVRSIIMYKCPDEINQVFNEDTRVCEYQCKSAGSFANPLNCSTYYVCSDHKDYLPRQVSCPEKNYFNGTACISNSAQCPSGSIPNTDTDASEADVGGSHFVNVGSLLQISHLITSPLFVTPLLTEPVVGPLINVSPFGGPGGQKCTCCPQNYYFNGTVCINNSARCPSGPTSDADNEAADVVGSESVNVGPGASITHLITSPLITTPLFTSPLVAPLVSVSTFGNKSRLSSQKCACCPEKYYFNGTACIHNSAPCPAGPYTDTGAADVAGTDSVNVGPLVEIDRVITSPLITGPLLTGPVLGTLLDISPSGNKGPSVLVG